MIDHKLTKELFVYFFCWSFYFLPNKDIFDQCETDHFLVNVNYIFLINVCCGYLFFIIIIIIIIIVIINIIVVIDIITTIIIIVIHKSHF